MKTQKTILNENTKKENKTTPKTNAKATFEKVLKNSNQINYLTFNKNKQLKNDLNAFIASVKTNAENENGKSTIVKVSNEQVTTFFDILENFTSKKFFDEIINANINMFTIKKTIANAILANGCIRYSKVDRGQDWTLENTEYFESTKAYKMMCDFCHIIAIEINAKNKLSK